MGLLIFLRVRLYGQVARVRLEGKSMKSNGRAGKNSSDTSKRCRSSSNGKSRTVSSRARDKGSNRVSQELEVTSAIAPDYTIGFWLQLKLSREKSAQTVLPKARTRAHRRGERGDNGEGTTAQQSSASKLRS